MLKSTLTFSLLLSLTILSGCGMNSLNLVNPPSVSAQDPPPPGCDANGNCFAHIENGWSYFQYSTLAFQQTFSGAVEIGVSANAPDANASIVGISLGHPGDVVSISGNIDYKSWSKSPASMIVDLRACTAPSCDYPSEQEHLMTIKAGADPGSHTALPFRATFRKPIHVDHFLLVFNDDLPEAKPTTISVGFSGEFK